MHTKLCVAWVLALGLVGCFSPTYHDGNLKCTASGQCPKGLHCAVDKTCWHNGKDPDAAATAGDTSADVPQDAAGDIGQNDRVAAPDLTSDTEVVFADVPVLTDVVSPKDLPVGPDSSTAETEDASVVPVPDAPPTDAPMQADGGDASSAETASNGVPLEQLAAEYARIVCAKDFACCTQSDLKGKTLATCEQNVTNLFQVAVQAVTDGISRGRTNYYPDRAKQCLQVINQVDCTAWPVYDPGTWLPPICEDAIAPQVASGGPCRSAAECLSGLCTGASSSADGTCLPKAAIGQGCEPIIGQNSCQSGLYCDSTKLCASTKVDGVSCSQTRECKSLACLPAPDAGSLCSPAACYSNGPLLTPACSFGGRPSAFAGGLVVAALALSMRRRRSCDRRQKHPSI
jgi:hypothetical protein